MILLVYFLSVLTQFSVLCSHGKSFWSFVHVIIYSIGAAISTLMSISDGLDLYIFLSKNENDAVYERKIGQKGVFSRHSRHFSLVNKMIKVLFPFSTLNLRVNTHVSRRKKVKIGETKILLWLWKVWPLVS